MSKHPLGDGVGRGAWAGPGHGRGRLARLLALPVVAALAGGLLAIMPAAPAQAACANTIVCENQMPGTPPSVWDVSSGEGSTIQKVADPFSVNLGGTINLRIEIAGEELQDRHLSDGLLRRRRRKADHERHAKHLGDAEPGASLQHQHHDRSGQLRQLGRVRELDCPGDGRVRRLFRAHPADGWEQRREPDPVRG